MYICVCKGVSAKDVEEVVKEVGNSIEKVRNQCGAGTDCGACKTRLEKFLEEGLPALPKTGRAAG